MVRRLKWWALAVAWVGLAPGTAAADEDNPWASSGTFTVGVGNSDAPFGFICAELDVDPLRYFGVALGVGYAKGTRQYGGLLRGRYPHGRQAFGLSVGVTQGATEEEECDDYCERIGSWDRVRWLRYEAYWEYRTTNSTAWRVSLGASSALSHSDCIDCDSPDVSPRGKPYATVGIGTYF